jgi:capsular polysaccharide biosynthesis protein
VITEPRQGTSGLGESSEGDLILPAGDLFQVIWRRLWVILLTILLCVGLAVGYSLQQTPLYQASIKILVGQDQGFVTDPVQTQNLQNLALTLSEAVTTRPVGESVVRRLDLRWPPEYVVYRTSAEVIADTQFIEVTYTDTDPRRAQRIVNAIGDAFSERVSEVSPKVSGVSATVWERADTPQSPVSPNPLRNGLIAFVVGGMLGVGLAFLLEYLDDSWRSPEEAEQVSRVPTLGVIPKFESPKGEKR